MVLEPVDVLTGWDLRRPDQQRALLEVIDKEQPKRSEKRPPRRNPCGERVAKIRLAFRLLHQWGPVSKRPLQQSPGAAIRPRNAAGLREKG